MPQAQEETGTATAGSGTAAGKENCKKKRKMLDLKTLWDRASNSKTTKLGPGSTSMQQPEPVTIEDAPSLEPVTIESQVEIQSAPEIQRQLANCCAKETTRLIMDDLGDGYFAILADESSDVYQKEQLALCLRYVDKKGRVVERFLGIVHVANTTSLALKAAIEKLLMEHSLSLSKVRGQGYDGASNMKGHANGLKKLIMDESPSAYYVHCFAHQLQLTLVAVAKDNPDCIWFFEQLRFVLNLLGNFCKKTQMLQEAQAQRIMEEFDLGDIETGKGLNQEMGLGRPADTRWGSHYKTVMHFLSLYPSIVKVLIKVGNDRSQGAESIQAQTILATVLSFEFVFMAHLMQQVLGFTADLNHALQKRDQDIVNAVELIVLTKCELQALRDDSGWNEFLKDVQSFCVKHKIDVPNMDSVNHVIFLLFNKTFFWFGDGNTQV